MGRKPLLLILFVAVTLILSGCTTNENVENKPLNIQVVATPSEGYQPLEVLFSVDMTSIDGTIQSILWDFGDGTTSTEVSPSHTFSAGTYNVVVDVTSDRGVHYHGNVTISVYNHAPTVTVSANPLGGKAPLQVQFNASAEDPDGLIVSYLWSFGDGLTSSQQNPIHTYTSTGTFNVSLIVKDNDGATAKDTITIKVTSNIPPTAEILASATEGTAPLTVHFEGNGMDEDGQIISYFWNFGDGSTSTEQNPVHTYQSSGVYTVTLTVTDDSGAKGSTNITINVLEPPAVQILSHSSYYNLGYFMVVGEVQNTGNKNVEFVKIVATFYDANNNVVGTGYTYTDIDILVPGQKSPFEISSYPQKLNVDHYDLQVDYKVTSETPYRDVTILSHSSYISHDYYYIVGEVQNVGDKTIEFVKIVATFYNGQGIVVGKSFTYTEIDEIAPGQKSPFELTSYPRKASEISVDHYSLQVQARIK